MTSSADQNQTPVIPTIKLPPTSWSFIDCNPKDVLRYYTIHQHVFSIGGISKKMEMEQGTSFDSGVFSIKIGEQTTDWCLQFRPNGDIKNADSKGHVGVYLKMVTATDFPINASVTLSILDKEGSNKKSATYQKTFQTAIKDSWGWPKLISHADLKFDNYYRNSLFLPDDTLTIHGEVTIKGDGESKRAFTWGNQEESDNKFRDDLVNLFHGSKLTDVTIVCKDREFQCHKAVLAGRSTVFEAMFTHEMKEKKDSKVDIQDMDEDTLHDMLVFMYSGRVGNLEGKAASLMSAGEKYDLKELKQICEEYLCFNLNLDNVLDMLILADFHSASNLRSLALKFIGENLKKIVTQEGWREKIRMYPDLMADMMAVIVQKVV